MRSFKDIRLDKVIEGINETSNEKGHKSEEFD